jgi:hypothetical protein
MDKKIKKDIKDLEVVNETLYRDKDETRKQHDKVRHKLVQAERLELKADKKYDAKKEKAIA